MESKRVAVAMSGGKDSTAAVLLLKRQGYEVVGVTMALGLRDDPLRIEKLKVLSSALSVPLQVIEFSQAFERWVRLPFVSSYLANLTPNPCAHCNREIKFGRFMEEALRISGADCFATGHYAALRREGATRFLCEPKELRKSQIYFLALIDPRALGKTLFPLADMGIDEVRAMTRDLPLVNREESQDVCFLAGEKLSTYLAREIDESQARGGEIVNPAGEVMGHHEGLHHYTIGQRRGVGFAGGRRLYVVAKDPVSNRLVLGEETDLLTDIVRGSQPNYWRPLSVGERLKVKIRYQTPPRWARVSACDETAFELKLEEPIMAVTPGQIAVLYDDQCLVAAGEMA